VQRGPASTGRGWRGGAAGTTAGAAATTCTGAGAGRAAGLACGSAKCVSQMGQVMVPPALAGGLNVRLHSGHVHLGVMMRLPEMVQDEGRYYFPNATQVCARRCGPQREHQCSDK